MVANVGVVTPTPTTLVANVGVVTPVLNNTTTTIPPPPPPPPPLPPQASGWSVVKTSTGTAPTPAPPPSTQSAPLPAAITSLPSPYPSSSSPYPSSSTTPASLEGGPVVVMAVAHIDTAAITLVHAEIYIPFLHNITPLYVYVTPFLVKWDIPSLLTPYTFPRLITPSHPPHPSPHPTSLTPLLLLTSTGLPVSMVTPTISTPLSVPAPSLMKSLVMTCTKGGMGTIRPQHLRLYSTHGGHMEGTWRAHGDKQGGGAR